MTLYKLLINTNELTEVSIFAWGANCSINLIAYGSALNLFKTLTPYLLECDITNIEKYENHIICTLKIFITRVE